MAIVEGVSSEEDGNGGEGEESEESDKEEENICPICLNELDEGEDLLICPQCTNHLHQHCMDICESSRTPCGTHGLGRTFPQGQWRRSVRTSLSTALSAAPSGHIT